MDAIEDKRVEYIDDIISEYITAICCIKDSFYDINEVLNKKKKNANNNFKSFILGLKSSDANNDIISKLNSKNSYINRFGVLTKKLDRSEQALNILPQSLFISLVSQYDVLIAQLVRFIYMYSENKLLESDSQISLREVFKIGDIDKIKEKFISDKIDSILRDSHTDQIKTLSKMIGDVPLDKVDFWKDFVEITQRRNLFVHCKGTISGQYINECKKWGVICEEKIGTILNVDDEYFSKAFNVFYCMGVMLSQVISRVVLSDDLIGEIDSVLNNIIYETISEERYDIAIMLSEFAINKNTKHNNKLDEKYFILNYAQAYKWKGMQEKCKDILDKYDFSESKEDILVAKYALEDDVENVIKSMRIIGDKSDIMTDDAYATWEIFKGMREKNEFVSTFEEIFNKPLLELDEINITEQTKDIIEKL